MTVSQCEPSAWRRTTTAGTTRWAGSDRQNGKRPDGHRRQDPVGFDAGQRLGHLAAGPVAGEVKSNASGHVAAGQTHLVRPFPENAVVAGHPGQIHGTVEGHGPGHQPDIDAASSGS